MYINIGPSHPATHGTFRIYARLEGELIEKAGVDVGYLHRGFEKIVEIKQYGQVIPYTDRLNYCIGPHQQRGLLQGGRAHDGPRSARAHQDDPSHHHGIQRIMDHMICVGTTIVDVGALTNFWYFYNARDKLNELLEALTARDSRIRIRASADSRGIFRTAGKRTSNRC
jgi:NADH:ubiquinone oxidoreductase subunit D